MIFDYPEGSVSVDAETNGVMWNPRQTLVNNFSQVRLVMYGMTAFVLLLLLTARASAVDDRTPEQIIEDTATRVLTVLNEQRERLRADPTLVNDLIKDTVVPMLDMVSMGKLILGKYWKQATEEQRSSFITEFKDMLIRIYAKAMLDFGHARVTVFPDSGKQQGKYHTVQTELDIGSGKTPLQVAYVFRNNKQNEWKVFDFSVDGLSFVKSFRTSFNQEIKETSLDALIKRLEDSNRAGNLDDVQTEVKSDA